MKFLKTFYKNKKVRVRSQRPCWQTHTQTIWQSLAIVEKQRFLRHV
jgi:hypothetical protein